jgi:hypothetical protein
LPTDAKVIIKYSVEVEGLPVYQETYDVEKLGDEIEADRSKFKELWLRRVECVVECRHKDAFSASLTGCLADGLGNREASEQEVSEVLCLGPFIFIRLAPISPRRGSAQQFPPSRGVLGARSPHSKGVSLIC